MLSGTEITFSGDDGMAKEKKSLGEDVTALTPEDVVKAYGEAHPKRKSKKK